jgi:hypothetical protein
MKKAVAIAEKRLAEAQGQGGGEDDDDDEEEAAGDDGQVMVSAVAKGQ